MAKKKKSTHRRVGRKKPAPTRKKGTLTDGRSKRLTLSATRDYLWKYYGKHATTLGWGKSKYGIPKEDVADIRFRIMEAYAAEDTGKGKAVKITAERIRFAFREKFGGQIGGMRSPKIPEGMMSDINYWELTLYVDWVREASERVTFTSPKILGNSTLQGGKYYAYSETFQTFVNQCNEIYRTEPFRSLGSGDRTYIRTSPPRRGKDGKWRSVISVYNEAGEPLIVPVLPKEPVGKEPEGMGAETDGEDTDSGATGESEALDIQRSKEAEATALKEVERQRSIQKLMDMYGEGKLNEKQFERLLEAIERK